MGSWNKTCAMSNLPIYDGEDCLMVLLKEAGGNDRCYSTALWRPSLFAVSCKYADYGRADNLNHQVFEPLILGLQKSIDEYELGENQYHDIEVKRDALDEKLFFEAVHEGRLSITETVYDGTRSKRTIDFILIKQSIIDRVFKDWYIEFYEGVGKGNRGYKNSYLNVYLKDVLDTVPDFVNKIIIEYDKHVRSDNEIMFYLKRTIVEDHIISKIVSCETYRNFKLFNFKETIVDYISAGKIEQAEEIVKSHIIGCFIDSFFESTRKIWVPACHEGSQNTETLGYIALANAVIAECEDEEDDYDGAEE